MFTRIVPIILSLVLSAGAASAQTSTFSYDGRLSNGGSPANGNYDFELKLFDAVSGGAQQGATIQRLNIAVANGTFQVNLDFGAAVFPGADRFLEIGVRPSGPGAFTVLSPRQQILSAPYVIRSLSAATADSAMNTSQLGGIAASGFIQNTSSQQAATNFNIGGNGTAGGTLAGNLVNTATQYQLNNSHILSAPGTNNLFAGAGAGQMNTTGSNNAFFGRNAGAANTSGGNNSFFGARAGSANNIGLENSFVGAQAGMNNTGGNYNSFFGYNAGLFNTTASNNTFFGNRAGQSNTTGGVNSFFGRDAGFANTEGTHNSFFGTATGYENTMGLENSFFGTAAGLINTNGSANAFFGYTAGAANTIGSKNTLIGHSTDVGANNLSFATALGAGAVVASSNTIVLGRGTGLDAVQVPGSLSVSGALTGSGASLTNLNANNITSGMLPIARGGTGSATQSFVDLSTAQTIAGTKTFTSTVAGSINGNAATVTNGVYTTGDQTIGGTKNFSAIGVGIGTSTPGAKLEIAAAGNGPANLYITSNSQTPRLEGRKSNGTSAAPTATTAGENLLVLGGSGHTGTSFTNLRASIYFFASQDWTSTANGTSIYFLTTANGSADPDYRMYIGHNGDVGIGITEPGDRLDIVGDIRVGTGGFNGCIKRRDGNSIVGTCSSDLRLKRDITPFPNLLDKVAQLRPVHYYWRAAEFPQKHFGHTEAYGLVAQEVELLLPELVSTDEQGFKAVDYAKLPFLLLQSVKELKAENEALRQQQIQLAAQQQQNALLQQQLKEQRGFLQQQRQRQRDEIAELKRLVCLAHPRAAACRVIEHQR